ncbi:type II secretion system minor pseudopilin GspK [Geotalea sp. SG265]|uniref:type II secretion system minor pseudopilin GspK n=1 Tax=Geotalea sp. SG265 TaxID=2922867 RepID=UPI001FAF1DFE
MRDQRGFALVLTLLITALLVALSVQFIDEVYVDTSISHNYVAAQQASILAASGVEGATRLLQYSQSLQSYTTLLDPWAQPLQFEEEQGKLVVSISEESGKLNLNDLVSPDGTVKQPYYDIAVRLFKTLNLSPDLLDALVDWIDVNEEPHPAGAESAYYNKLKPPYRAKNGKLDTFEELRLVKGFDSKVLGRLRPFVTVYADAATLTAMININTAPKEILVALSERMSDDLASRILDRRKTTPFKNPYELAQVAGMESIAQGLSLLTTTKGTIYRIQSEALVKETSRVAEAVVRTSDGKFLYWREY